MLSFHKLISSQFLSFGLFLFLNCHVFVFAQKTQSFDEIFEKIEASEDDFKRNIFLRTYLQKAIEEKNQEEIVNGYRNYLYYREGELLNFYIDSMKWAAYETQDNRIIGDVLLSVGIQKYKQKSYGEALSYYLNAHPYISNLRDEYLEHKLLYCMAQVYYVLGFIDLAIEKFERCIIYFEDVHLDGYLNSIHGLASCYLELKNYERSSELVHKGIEISNRNSSQRLLNYFHQLESIIQYYSNNYEFSLNSLHSTTESILNKGDFANAQVGYFYLGKIYQRLEDVDKALHYYQKIDSLFIQHSYVRPNLRTAYDYLIENYALRNQVDNRFYYMKQRHEVDKMTETMYINLYPKLFQSDFNKGVITTNNNSNFKFIVYLISILIAAVAVYFLSHHYTINKFKFSNLKNFFFVQSGSKGNLDISKESKENQLVPLESLESLLPRLEKFEKERKYLEKDWKQTELAVYLKSNVRYCNLMIQHFRGKHYTHYMNDLKIDYVVELLRKDSRVRKYSNSALAKEGGFNSTEKFVKAFKLKMGQNIMEFIEDEIK